MNKMKGSALAAAATMGSLLFGLLLAGPARAEPSLSVSVEDRIRYFCEASSADPEGKRLERRCRAEWRDRILQMGAKKQRGIRVVLR